MPTWNPAPFRERYKASLVPGRILLTGHSHQAWPDAARAAQAAYFDDAATHVDDKWGKAIFPKLANVGAKVLERLGFQEKDTLAFGKSTHELVFRLLTCWRWDSTLKVVTTTSEFHSLHRQLARLQEEGVQVTWVDATDRSTLAERLMAAVTPGTTLLALSGVLFEDAYVVPHLGDIISHAVKQGALPLVDAYHAFNVAPLDWGPHAQHVWVTAGGYKYAQFGEGLCWLRVPPGTTLRPVYTGWFADFESLEKPRSPDVHYSTGGMGFSGATFDASSVYRAEAALQNFETFGLTPARLRDISQHQTAHLIQRLEHHGVFAKAAQVSAPDPHRRAGFVTIRHAQAQALVGQLRERGVYVDARGPLLRMGPAPYVLDDELDEAARILAGLLQKS